MRESVIDTGGRDLRNEDLTYSNGIIELLENRLVGLGIENHIIGDGIVFSLNQITAGFAFINGKIRIFDTHSDPSGIPSGAFNVEVTTVEVESVYFDNSTKTVENIFKIIPEDTGSINLRELPREKEALAALNINRYYKENFSGGEAVQGADGTVVLGRNGNVTIGSDGEVLARTGESSNQSTFDALRIGSIGFAPLNGIGSSGNIETQANLIGVECNTSGDQETTGGHFIGDNAPKVLILVSANGTLSTSLGSQNITSGNVVKVSDGIYQVNGTYAVPLLPKANAVSSDGVPRIANAIGLSTSVIRVYTYDDSGVAKDSAFVLEVFW